MGNKRVALAFEHVTLTYVLSGSLRHTALHSFDVEVRPGEWVAIMGANGSGKSTFARLAAGLLTPTEGTVTVCGETTTSPGYPRVRSRIGYLSQHPEHHVIGLTVGEDVALGPRALGLSETQIKNLTQRALHAVGLGALGAKRTDALSGGELQRVALAGVLALEPELLILDEPTAFADPAMRRTLLDVVRDVCRARSAQRPAVVWVTHYSDEAMQADRVIVLHRGRIVYDGKPNRLWDEPERARQWGIGPPTTQIVQQRTESAVLALSTQLTMRDLTFAYAPEDPDVLSGVDLDVRAGECVALVGGSGAGKSSLLQVAALLEPRTSGELCVVGEEIPQDVPQRRTRHRLKEVVRAVQPHIGLAFQQPEVQLFGMTVRDDFEFGLRHLGVPSEEWADRITHALLAVGLDDRFLERSPFALSGGERRKVAIALCIAQRPALYLFDEPTAGLDYTSRAELASALQTLTSQGDTAVLFATHDMGLVAQCATRTVALCDGRLYARCGEEAPASEPGRANTAQPGATDSVGEHDSALGSIDSRVKVASASVLAVAIASTGAWAGLTASMAVVGLLSYVAALRPRQVWAVVRGVLPFIIIAAVFSSLAVLGHESNALVLLSGMSHGLYVGMRMILVIVSVMWLTHVTSVGDLLYAMRSLMSPLTRIGVPVASLVAATLVGARMIPIVAEEARKIYRAQVMRGIERVRGWRGRWLRLSALVLPLTSAILRRAEHLGEALVTRGFSGEVVPMQSSLQLRKAEWTFLVSLSIAIVFIIVCDRLWGSVA